MQMDLLEKMRKDIEEKESQATKVPSVATHINEDKGKGRMETFLRKQLLGR